MSTDPSECPRIKLGRREFLIPELAVRQIMVVVPAIARAAKINWQSPSEEDFGTLYAAVYAAVTRAMPKFKREEFDDLPITLEQLLAALPIIAKQAGMEATPAKGAADGSVGEAPEPEQTAT